MKDRITHALISFLCIIFVLSFGLIYSGIESEMVISSKHQNSINIAIIMYHSISKDDSNTGEYIAPLETLESDIRYLYENGYSTVHISDLIAYVYDGVPLPEKSVVLTFDDGHYNFITYALPLLLKHDMKASIAVVGSFCDTSEKSKDTCPEHAYMSRDDVSMLSGYDAVEVLNHSYFMHDLQKRPGAGMKPGETFEAYKNAFTHDTLLMQQSLQRQNISPAAYVYPYGIFSNESEELLQSMGFLSTLTTVEKTNIITIASPQSLFALGRYNRDGRLSTYEFMQKLGL